MRAVFPDQEIQRESKEARPFFVSAVDNVGNLVDVRGEPVEVSFTANESTRPTTWHVMAWTAGAALDTPIGSAWEAKVQVGGTGSGATVALAVGTWYAYVRVGDAIDVERPVLFAGRLRVK